MFVDIDDVVVGGNRFWTLDLESLTSGTTALPTTALSPNEVDAGGGPRLRGLRPVINDANENNNKLMQARIFIF